MIILKLLEITLIQHPSNASNAFDWRAINGERIFNGKKEIKDKN